MDMQIKLAHSFVKDLEFKKPLVSDDILEEKVADESDDEDSFGLGFSVAYHKDKCDEFAVIFKATVSLTSGWVLDTQFVSVFETSTAIDDDFKESPFPEINAPAIAFPFLRSFVATFLLNAGHPTVIFPTINFTKFTKEQEVEVE